MRKNLKGSIPFEFIYSEAESSSEDEIVGNLISSSNDSHPYKLDSDEGYYISSEESVKSNQSVTSEPSYFSVESDNDSIDWNGNFSEFSESSPIDLERDFDESQGQEFDESRDYSLLQEASQSENNILFESLLNRSPTSKFSLLSTIYDKPCVESENLTERENSTLFFCTNTGCQEVFQCEEDLQNHLLSQYDPAKNQPMISQQQSETNADPKQQYNSNIVGPFKRLECDKHIRNRKKNNSYSGQRYDINFLEKNIYSNNLNITDSFISDESQLYDHYFTSRNDSNRYNGHNHSKSSQDDDNEILGGQRCEQNFSSKNALKSYLNRFQPIIYNEQTCKSKKFNARFKEIPSASYNSEERRFNQRFRCESDRTIHFTKKRPHIYEVYNKRFI